MAGLETDDQDIGFSPDKDIIRPPKKPYEIDFKILSPEEIQQQQDVQIKEVAEILNQPPEAAAILLRHLRWNKERLFERYMENQEELLDAVGLEADASHTPKTRKASGFSCEICCEEGDQISTYALKCGHRYCVDCYTQYLASKIKDEGEAARIQCPTSGCKRIVDSKSLDFLVEETLKNR